MTVVILILSLIGALGVFIYGMKVMSESLQKVAGAGLRRLLGRLTANRFSGVLTGFTITSLVQSSSATTVMVVGFVSAGLLTLIQAIGVIMGANIGTTITGWLVALLGFKVKITSFALPAIGIGLGMTLFKRPRVKQWGEVLLGFGLLFLGLWLLKKAVPKISAEQIAWVKTLADKGLLTTILFVLVGTVLTVILQSSSATMTLTLTLTATGQIPYVVAAAMILGENIGTTATANIAAIGTSATAKRAARAHLIFNVFGVVWAIALFKVALLPGIDALVPGDPLKATGVAGAAVVTAHLAAFHTAFNVINTALMLPFVNPLAQLVTRLVKERPTDEPKPVLSRGVVETPELAILQARRQMQQMAEVGRKMYGNALEILRQPKQDLGDLVRETQALEERLDGLEREVTNLVAMTVRASTSAAVGQQLAEMALNTHRVERIGDHCEKLVFIAINNHKDSEHQVGAEALTEIEPLAAKVGESLDNLARYLGGDDSGLAGALEKEINRLRDELRERYEARLAAEEAKVGPILRLLEIIHHLEEIGDRTYGIVRRAEEVRKNRRGRPRTTQMPSPA